MISASTRVFAVLGDPVAHSLSPAMHNAAFRALGLDAVYVAFHCAPGGAAALIAGIARAGGGGNVTLPHKAEAAGVVERATGRLPALGVCNTFWGEDGQVAGDNTDVDGVLASLRQLEAPAGPWLLAGTGGSARAVVAAAAERGAAVAVRSRSSDRAAAFQAWAKSLGVAPAAPDDCRVLINATPLGLRPDDPLPLALDMAPAAVVALDLVYAPGETRWVRAMRGHGLRAADGRVMLVAQGAAAFARWFDGVQAPVDVMRAAVDAALR